MLFENTKNIFRRISHAAMRAGRCPSDVRLIAVTKTVSIEAVFDAAEVGLRDFGESRVQEAAPKIELFREKFGDIKASWHLIGHLQKNKAKKAVELFDLIHSVDSVELACAIDRHACEIGKVQRVLVQVKLSGEESKSGASKDDVWEIVRAASSLKNISVEGFMTVPPYADDPEDARPYFRELRSIRDAVSEKTGLELRELSMGMSGDFEVAIEEGATMVRVGTAIFGDRRKENL